MSMRTIRAQLFGFAALLAALLVLPQVALAHAGHAHATHVHATDIHTSYPDATRADARTADGSVARAERFPAEQFLTAAAQDRPGRASDVPCDRGCCAQSSCATCFSMVAPVPPLMLPPTLRTEINDIANFRRSGIDGPSLLRPPKSFA